MKNMLMVTLRVVSLLTVSITVLLTVLVTVGCASHPAEPGRGPVVQMYGTIDTGVTMQSR